MAQHESEGKPPFKVNVTISLDRKIYEALKDDAKSHGMSLNSKLNAVLEKYVTFYRIAEGYDCVIMPHSQYKEMLNIMDENKLTNILVKIGNADVLSAFHQNAIPITMKTLIDFAFKQIAVWSGTISSFSFFTNPQGHLCLVFEHKFGEKWSRIFSGVIEELIHISLQYPTRSDLLANTFVIEVLKNDIITDIFHF